MKNLRHIIIATAVITTGLFASETQGKASVTAPPDKGARQAALESRASEIKDYQNYVDSTVLSRSYRFIPNALEQLPASGRFNFSDPRVDLIVTGDSIIASLPYIAGPIEPYELVMMEISGPVSSDYTEKLEDGKWTIQFSSSDIGPQTYRFILRVNRDGGSSELEIRSSDYPTVIYYGSFTSR